MNTKYRRAQVEHKTGNDFWSGFGWGLICVVIVSLIGVVLHSLTLIAGQLL